MILRAPALALLAGSLAAAPAAAAPFTLPPSCAESPGQTDLVTPLPELRKRAEALIETDPTAAVQLLCTTIPRVAREKGEDSVEMAWWVGSLATPLIAFMDRHAEAEAPLQHVVEVGRRVWGEERAETLEAMHRLAIVERKLGKLVEAEDLFATALERRRRTLGDEHADTLESMHALASLYHDQVRLAKAVEIYVQELEILRRVRGGEHPHTLTTMNDLGVAYQQLRRFAEAEPLFHQALEIQRRRLGQRRWRDDQLHRFGARRYLRHGDGHRHVARQRGQRARAGRRL